MCFVCMFVKGKVLGVEKRKKREIQVNPFVCFFEK